jgi:hypothetical protein
MTLPGFRGSAVYISLSASYVAGVGWTLSHWHRHDGEGQLCPGSTTYDGLTLAELVDVVVALFSDGNGRYRIDDLGSCHSD